MNLSEAFDEKSFDEFLKDFFPDFVKDERPVPQQNDFFPKVTYLGASEQLRTSVLVVHTKLGINSRISLTKSTFQILKNFGIYRALVVYLNPDQSIWRLSLLTAQPVMADGKIIHAFSNPERHSYVLGSQVGVATARKFLINMGSVTDFEDLKFRFSIEAINKEFYKDISKFFYELTGLYDVDGVNVQRPVLKLPTAGGHRENQEYSIRLFGRIIFCWFLKEKKSSMGNQLLPDELFEEAVRTQKNVLHNVLEPLFFQCLNTPVEDRDDKYREDFFQLVPYLNGGLFHPNDGPGGDYILDGRVSKVVIPDDWFRRLFETLATYNFTLDENLSFDVELSIDPEMLGRIFENLLAEINPESGESARKTTGSFYTPRQIVSHMTDIALKRYLLNRTGIDEEKIGALITIDSLDDAEFPLSESEKISISEALLSLRSLDPACGSGAFPIGLLQKLVYMLEQVDSKMDLGKLKFDKNYFAGKSHLAKNHAYLRKLVLIRDVIHGVDIQPIAVEISKLRCFLTLIVEQEVLDNVKNRGIEPLPNLDFQFVCANSLIKLDEPKKINIWETNEVEDEMTLIRNEFYSTTSKNKREALKGKYLRLVNRDISLFGETKRATQLRSFQPFVVNSQADFFDAQQMFGISEFDIVIGNPPYVKTEHFSDLVREQLLSEYSELRNGKSKPWVDDLYVHFIFRAFDLCTDEGIVCFITNDSFIGLASKSRVRNKIISENLTELIGCPRETFGATIYTAIFLACRSNIEDRKYYGSKFTYPDFALTERSEVDKAFISKLPNKRLVLSENHLVAKLLQGQQLGDYLRIIDTGIHSGNVREKIFSLEKKGRFKERLIQGRQIKRWAVNWDSPNAKFKYCDPFYEPEDVAGVGRGGKRSSLKEYWGFAGDMENHLLPKRILLRQTGDSLYAAFHSADEDGQLYTDNTLFTVLLKDVGSLEYFLALLNSKVLNYVYQFLSSEEGKTLAQVKTGLVEQLPAVFDVAFERQVTDLVKSLIALRRGSPDSDVSEIEDKLDELICEFFQLSDTETKIILSSSRW
jgi:hypothetical protein